MTTIEERTRNAKQKAEKEKQQRRLKQQAEIKEQKMREQRRNFIIGKLASQYFPEVLELDPGNESQWNTEDFEPLEAFLLTLSSDTELVTRIKEKAAHITLTENQGRGHLSSNSPGCVSGRSTDSESAYVRKGGDECG